jgi:aryl-alcohol dehydrogenase-like predicted oxidoreductase
MLDTPASSVALPTRPFGRTDMSITRVGFGAWAIGGAEWAFGWGAQDDRQSIEAIRHAVQSGINWIDTAAIYGLGHSEEVVREALSVFGTDRRPYVFTKCGLLWDEKDRAAMPRRSGAPASIKRECEASLKRLGVERIDLYQMHWPATDAPVETYWQALLDLKQEGKVRAVGLSNHSVHQLEAAEQIGHVDTLQPPFSAIRREFAADDLPWCLAHQTGVIVYSPMQAGLLTGTFSVERAKSLPKNDWRSRDPEYSGEQLRRNLKLVDAFKPIAEKHKTSVATIAVAWTLAWPGVTGAIVGARSPEQVDGWLDAARVELGADDMRAIAKAIESSGAGEGPAIPKGM